MLADSGVDQGVNPVFILILALSTAGLVSAWAEMPSDGRSASLLDVTVAKSVLQVLNRAS